MVLIDTSAWIEYFRGGDPEVVAEVDRCLQEEQVAMGDLIYCEVLQGIRQTRERRKVERLFSSLVPFDLVGFENADRAAANFRKLRGNGVTVRKTIDVLIGTFCANRGIRLIHNDRDFDLMAPHIGLKTARGN